MSNYPGSGAVKPVVIDSTGQCQGGPAIPVYGFDASTIGNRAIDGGPALPVKILTNADLVQNGGTYWLEGDPIAMPVMLATDGRPVEGRMPVPVYDVMGLLGGAAPIQYLLHDDFTTDASAPLTTPRTCLPGPGTATIIDTTNLMSISGNYLVFAGGRGASGDPAIWLSAVTRTPGVAHFLRFRMYNISAGTAYFGFDTNQAGSVGSAASIYASITAIGNNVGPALGVFDNLSYYQFAIVLRSTGFFVAVKGALYPDWTLLWVDVINNTSPVYPAFQTYDVAAQPVVDYMRVRQLSGGWLSDYGIATQRIASASPADTITMTADAIVEATWTAVTGATYELDVRRTDNDNRWVVRCDQAGSTIKLIERNAGGETERSSVAQTWTNGASYRIIVHCYGQTIKTTVTNTAKNSYTSASFNLTATGVKTSHAAVNLISWPRTVSLPFDGGNPMTITEWKVSP